MSSVLDLEAELAAGAEAPANAALDAAERPSEEIARAALAVQDPGHMPPKLAGKIRRASGLIDAGKFTEAARVALSGLEAFPDHPLAEYTLAVTLDHLGRLSRAIEFYERAWRKQPNIPGLFGALASVAWKLDMLDAAERFVRLQYAQSNAAPDSVINLGGILRDKMQFEDAVEVLRAGIYAHPDRPDLWNMLGSVMLAQGKAEEAATFYAETLRLAPDYARAYHNLGLALEYQGDTEGALANYQHALTRNPNPDETVVMKHGCALALFALGRIKEAHETYEVRLDPRFVQGTTFVFNCPRWDGRDLAEVRGKTLLLIGEQGVGDEILFLTAARELIEAVGPDGEVRIAVEPRLLPLMRRAFPDQRVGPHVSTKREGRDFRGAPTLNDDKAVELWTPMATPLKSLRPDLASFKGGAAYLKPDTDRVEAYRAEARSFGDGLKIGVLWKSLKMDAQRARFFPKWPLWKKLLRTPGCHFVDMQYGDTDAERDEAREQFGVELHRFDGLDLKDDFEGVTAAANALDLIIGPMNTTTNLAAASGCECWLLHAGMNPWTEFGADDMPWYPNTRSFHAARLGDWIPVMKAVAGALEDRVAATEARGAA